MAYDAVINWTPPILKKAKKGRYPAVFAVFLNKPNGSKALRYNQEKMNRLKVLNTPYGFWFIRGIARVIFNLQGNQKWNKGWTKKFGVLSRVPEIVGNKPKDQPLAQHNTCSGNKVRVLEVSGKWARIDSHVVRLSEIDVATKKRYLGGLRWQNYGGWIELLAIERMP